MLSALSRFITLLCLAFLAAYITLANWGVELAIAAGMAVLAVPLVYSYINLARLRKYVLQRLLGRGFFPPAAPRKKSKAGNSHGRKAA
jgi:hypothetical protein